MDKQKSVGVDGSVNSTKSFNTSNIKDPAKLVASFLLACFNAKEAVAIFFVFVIIIGKLMNCVENTYSNMEKGKDFMRFFFIE